MKFVFQPISWQRLDLKQRNSLLLITGLLQQTIWCTKSASLTASETKQFQPVELILSLFWIPQSKNNNKLALPYTCSCLHLIATFSTLDGTFVQPLNPKQGLRLTYKKWRHWKLLHLIYATAVLFITIPKINLTNNTTNSTDHIIQISFRKQLKRIETIV